MFMKKMVKSARLGSLRNVSFALIFALGLVGMIPRTGMAAVIPGDEAAADSSLRTADMEKIQAMLERKEVASRLADYGLTPAEVQGRVDQLSDEQITELAAQVDKINAGGDATGLIVTILVIVLVVVLILWLLRHTTDTDLKKAKQ